jgi:uncharacterized protein (DUF427 family)
MKLPEPFVEPTPRRIRVRLGGEVVADSTRAMLLGQYGPGGLPTYYLPMDDVRPGALSDERTEDERRTWTVRAGRRHAEHAAWAYPDPSGPLAPALAGHVTFSWRAVDWYEEDERVVEHARDPYHRVDTLRSSRRVQVLVDDVVVADSIRPLLLFETLLPTRYYLPFADVRTEFLEASDTVSTCPFKGTARYWSVRVGDTLIPDAAWSYPDPIPENPKIRDLLCFFNERVDLVLDGTPLERPDSPWSTSSQDEAGAAHLAR